MSIFITFEGGEGSGKSTQSEALAKRLESMGIPVLLTHEPGGTPMGEQIKDWLKGREAKKKKSNADADLEPQTELLLFNAARAQLVSKVIKPALEDDTVVICDRFYHSTTAYQGHGRGLDMDLVESINSLATGGLKPNLTILMDIDAQKGLERKKLLDRFEREDIDFHQRVRQSYLGMAHQDQQHWLVVNASLPQEEVESLIWEWVEQLLPAMRMMGKVTTEVEVKAAMPEPVEVEEEAAIPEPAKVEEEAIVSQPEEETEAAPVPAEEEAAPEPVISVEEKPEEESITLEEKKPKTPKKKKAAAKPKKETKKRVAKKKNK